MIIKNVTETERKLARVWFDAVERFDVSDETRKMDSVDIRTAFIHTAYQMKGVNNKFLAKLINRSYGIVTRTIRNVELGIFPDGAVYSDSIVFFRRELLGEEDSRLINILTDTLSVINRLRDDVDKANKTLKLVKRSLDIEYLKDLETKIKKNIK
tara:strand:- start:3284 stop:3748 length:465 start_codon:yes stop_codon:yes gene_type:complete